MLDIYKKTVNNILFSGPTCFAPCLQRFYEHCMNQMGQSQYNVLLIITDGEIHDMPQTKELLVQLSQLACSVIIVGVGKEDFTNMHVLDSDHHLLKADSGAQAVRDIVQFVEYDKAVAKGDLAE